MNGWSVQTAGIKIIFHGKNNDFLEA